MALRDGKEHPLRQRFESATNLKGEDLQRFCATLAFVDGEGNYRAQKYELRAEMADYLAGAVESNEVDGLIALVIDRALPESEEGRSNGEIYREDVLQRLGVTSERQLFPALPQFEKISDPIKREQHEQLLAYVLANPSPAIVHASGGVGKSVVAQQLVESLPIGSWGLVYDCFGAGNYRNESEPRHRARDALVQIANEMAVAGLCRPLIVRTGNQSDHLFRGFLDRMGHAIARLRSVTANAKLLLLIDAADNAEMAAADFGDKCFARALLRESLPDGCHLVALCRTERVDLLQPVSTVRRYQLLPFSPSETATYLRTFFPSASPRDATEFHRLTGGNPRVQANALAIAPRTVTDVLNSLGPMGTTIDDQITAQLDSALSRLKDKHPATFASQVDAICLGLANLPPFIPLNILANAARVDVSTIKSFVSDLGRPLWLSDDAVQFRDEPTETWFRKTFAAKKEKIRSFIGALEPLATESTYAAKSLPQLLHCAGEHQRLIKLALSDESLPEHNPIDARNIRVYRLQFAFKAALKLKRRADACRLAFRCGEEMAGDRRQMELLAKNVDLIPRLQSEHRVQELAYRGMLRSAWNGSENVYSAALLSSIEAFKGEARGYLRGADKWLQIYFEGRAKRKDDLPHSENLREEDVVEFAWAHFNLFGPTGAVRFLLSWKPPGFIFRVGRLLIRRLVDANQFDQIDEIARLGAKNIYLILAIADELIFVGRFPPKKTVEESLAFLSKKESKIEKAGDYSHQDFTTPAVISLCEAATAQGVSPTKILPVLRRHTAPSADRSVADNFDEGPRRLFLRGASLYAVLDGQDEPAPATFIAQKEEKRTPSFDRGEEKELREVIGALLPWYFLRARLLTRDPSAEAVDLEQVRSRTKAALHSRYRTHDRIPYEMSSVQFAVLALKASATSQELENFATNVIARADEKFYLKDRLPATRTAFRLTHLTPLCERLEQSCRRSIEGFWDQGPEERANAYIALARAVLPHSQADAAAYFSGAVEAVSKFGDEAVDRWNAVVAVASRAAIAKKASADLVFRFVQCGEMVGTTVAREKYWDRNEVFSVAVNLHAPSAFAALSRWRDRAVGWFNEQLRALATEAVKQAIIPPSCGWGLTGFLGCNASAEYATLCISRERDKNKRQLMLKMAFRDLQLAAVEGKEFQELETVAAEFPTQRAEIAETIAAMMAATALNSERTGFADPGKDREDVRINTLLEGINALDSGALNRANKVMHTIEPPRNFEIFWQKLIARVPPGRESEFLEAFLGIENLGYLDAGYVISQTRTSWLGKAAVQRVWPRFLAGIGKRFVVELTNTYRSSYWCEYGGLSALELNHVQNGIYEGLAESLELADAGTLFGFISTLADRVTPAEALRVLDYALGRFEIHIPGDFGDGEWAERLRPPVSMAESVVGLIWSALASPHSSTRWETAHCVRRLAALGCDNEIRALTRRMRKCDAGAFGKQALSILCAPRPDVPVDSLCASCNRSPQSTSTECSILRTRGSGRITTHSHPEECRRHRPADRTSDTGNLRCANHDEAAPGGGESASSEGCEVPRQTG
jgi:hypothetical protein